jgi:GTP-binding protein Era
MGATKKKSAGGEKRPRTSDEGGRRAGRVAIVGRPNVGKSTLLNALIGERIAIVSPLPQTTRDSILGILSTEGLQIAFVDTPGIHTAKNKLGARMNRTAEHTAEGADAQLLVVELGGRGQGLAAADKAILGKLPKIPTVLVLNKVDQVKPRSLLLPLLESLNKELGPQMAAIVPVSARSGNGVDRIVAELGKILPLGEPLFPEDEISDRPVRFFVAEFVREQILRNTRNEVPHGVAVTVESFEEEKKTPRILLTVHVDKDSHKPILVGKHGAMMKTIGTAARARVEELLGKQVHLELFVRVTPGWYENDALLRSFGYEEASR